MLEKKEDLLSLASKCHPQSMADLPDNTAASTLERTEWIATEVEAIDS